MEEKNELNDIILNKGGGGNGGKKVLLAVATLAVVLIIVVVIMNRLNSGDTSSLPQAVLPPEPTEVVDAVDDDPLFEPVEVIDEGKSKEDNLDKIARKLKEESMAVAEPVVEDPAPAEPVKPVKPEAKPEPVTPKVKPAVAKKSIAKGQYYIQVGSFSKYEPNASFLKKITGNGYSYTYHKVVRNGSTVNKVLVGPFESEREARSALPTIRKQIEPGAFLTKV